MAYAKDFAIIVLAEGENGHTLRAMNWDDKNPPPGVARILSSLIDLNPDFQQVHIASDKTEANAKIQTFVNGVYAQ